MGIKDLLRFMKPYIHPIHIKKYAGKRVGIDAYSWLHKGAYSCSMEICLDSDSEKKLRYLDYFMHRINLLRHYKITPVVVFDGASFPCKAATENERHKRRRANFEMAMEKFKEGNVNAASELFQRAVRITPLMAHQLIKILKSENIDFVVAPYEADAQLAYLSSLAAEKGGVAAVITEDSDLLAYGCQATIFKMDRYGNSEELILDEIFKGGNHKPSFRFFDKQLFTGMCVLAGCDFLPSVPGIGIVKAHSFIMKYRNLDRVLSVLKLEKGNQMPEDYIKSFKEATSVFQHARIYDANSKKLKYLKPLPQELHEFFGESDLNFLGPEIPPSIATAIAQGNLNPTNMEAFDSLPSSSHTVDTTTIRNSQKLQKFEVIKVSRQKKRFFNSNAGDSTGLVVEQDPVSIQRKYANEDLALQNLISRPESPATESCPVSEILPVKIPHNPFMIQKVEAHTEHINYSTLQHSNVMEDESSNLLCETPVNAPYKKRKLEKSDLELADSNIEPVSEVIDVEVLHTSQESVNSKSNITSQFNKVKNGKSIKDCQRKCTILSFFSRV